MLKATSYARFSSDMQKESSIEDQLRICEQQIKQQGWESTAPYSDYAISGASMARAGLKHMMDDAAKGAFDIVVVEGLDRLSRDAEHMPGIYKRLSFNGVRIYSLTDGGFMSDIHIAFGGAKNALFLKDLAFKVKRGQAGVAQKGKVLTKKIYGYDIVRRFDGEGNVVRGERKINPEEAVIVRRIFADYLAGKSALKIAAELNAQNITNASGGQWSGNVINGNRNRGKGLLNNETYIGRLVWNRYSYQKNPDTEQRIERPNDKADWVVTEVPQLRIIEQDVWDQVKARQKKRGMATDIHQKRRPKHLLSFLLKCGACGGGYSKISHQYYGCFDARDKQTCNNRLAISQKKIESAVLETLATQLLNPRLFDVFTKEYRRHLKTLNESKDNELRQLNKRLKKLDNDKARLIDAIKAGLPADELKDEFNDNAAHRAQIIGLIEQFNRHSQPQTLQPDMVVRFHEAIESLKETPTPKGQHDPRIELIQTLIDKVVLTPLSGTKKLKATLHGDLAALMALDVHTYSAHSTLDNPTTPNTKKQGMTPSLERMSATFQTHATQ